MDDDDIREFMESRLSKLTPQERYNLMYGTWKPIKERYFICAPTHLVLRLYCRNRDIPRERVYEIDQRERVFGLEGEVVVVASNDGRSLDFSNRMREVLGAILEREKAGIISLSWEDVQISLD